MASGCVSEGWDDTLAELDHPSALAVGGSCQKYLYRTWGHSKEPGTPVAMDTTKPVKDFSTRVHNEK